MLRLWLNVATVWSPLPSQVYYAGQLRFGGFSFDCHKVGPEQKNIFFPPLCRPRLQYKGHRLPFPTPWEANITFFRARLLSPRTWAPYHLSLTRLLL